MGDQNIHKRPNINIYTIHDCVAVIIGNVSILNREIALVYKSLYSDTKYLEKFHNNMIDRLYTVHGITLDKNNKLSIDKRIYFSR